MRRSVCAQRSRPLTDNFVSVRTIESGRATKSGVVLELIRRLLDTNNQKELINYALCNTNVLKENYDAIVILFSRFNAILNKETLDIIKNIISAYKK